MKKSNVLYLGMVAAGMIWTYLSLTYRKKEDVDGQCEHQHTS